MAVVLNPNLQDDKNKAPDGSNLQTIGTAAPNSQAPSTAAPMNSQGAPAPAQPQGSGRFTNIQKYLQANKSGGQQVASQIGQNIQNDLSQKANQAQTYYNQLGKSVNNANQVAQAGSGYEKQLQGIGQDINNAQTAGFAGRDQANLNSLQNFTQQPDFSKFQDIQAGRGIDENLLSLQQQKALSQAQQTQSAAQQANTSLGNEAGRFDLLRQTFGGNNRPGYSQGQQRLDQVLLGQGGGLGQVQSDVAKQAQAADAQAKLAAAQGNEVNRLTQQEKGLVTDINSQAGKNEQSYQDLLKSYIDPLNAQRTQDFSNLNSAISTYVPKYDAKGNPISTPYQSGFNDEQMARLGLTDKNQGVYNTFKDQAFTSAPSDNQSLANVIATQGAQAQNIQDVANQNDVDRYQALAKILGDQNPTINQAGNLGASYTAKTGDAGLKERLAAAQAAFDAKDQVTGSDRWGDVTGYASAKNLINQGRIPATDLRWNATGGQVAPNAAYANGRGGLYRDVQQGATAGIYNNLQNLLNQQNYNQTIGGRRNTFFDTEAAAKIGGTPKLNATPITQEDPTLNKSNNPDSKYFNVSKK